MRIELHCRCGASGAWEMPADTAASAMIASREWRSEHEDCSPRSATAAKAGEQTTIDLLSDRLVVVTRERDHLRAQMICMGLSG